MNLQQLQQFPCCQQMWNRRTELEVDGCRQSIYRFCFTFRFSNTCAVHFNWAITCVSVSVCVWHSYASLGWKEEYEGICGTCTCKHAHTHAHTKVFRKFMENRYYRFQNFLYQSKLFCIIILECPHLGRNQFSIA